jgi:hypothetical protein
MTRKLIRTLATEYPFAVIEPTRGGHIRLRLLTGKITSATRSDQRAGLNTRAEIRRRMRQSAGRPSGGGHDGPA